ncbi:hypothetical protein [Bradyrhizobium algeriense]|uniref:hypothetical protein n=1 Tax=Bradyrhizobium algeriense TaxID=634784 RepID=UPI0011AEAFF6|nr:hypothetical protein [Bradyrhizobium algeriense]
MIELFKRVRSLSTSYRSLANCCAARCWSARFVIRAAARNARAAKEHQVHVLTVSYAGGRVRQFSVRRERVAEVRRWLDNYQKLKDAIEAICELNHHLLRPDAAVPRGRKKRD